MFECKALNGAKNLALPLRPNQAKTYGDRQQLEKVQKPGITPKGRCLAALLTTATTRLKIQLSAQTDMWMVIAQ